MAYKICLKQSCIIIRASSNSQFRKVIFWYMANIMVDSLLRVDSSPIKCYTFTRLVSKGVMWRGRCGEGAIIFMLLHHTPTTWVILIWLKMFFFLRQLVPSSFVQILLYLEDLQFPISISVPVIVGLICFHNSKSCWCKVNYVFYNYRVMSIQISISV